MVKMHLRNAKMNFELIPMRGKASGNTKQTKQFIYLDLQAKGKSMSWQADLHQPQRTGSVLMLYASARSSKCSRASKQYSCLPLSSLSSTTPFPTGLRQVLVDALPEGAAY